MKKIRPLLSRTNTNLVEIDLLRGGQRMPRRAMKECDYYALVNRAQERPQVGFWPFRLREPLSSMPISLREGEPEPTLDLQALLHGVSDAAGYELFICASEPEPPLPPVAAVWAAQHLNTTAPPAS